METDEEKIEESFTPVEIILAFIIPFILFWGGMLSTVFLITFGFTVSQQFHFIFMYSLVLFFRKKKCPEFGVAMR